MSFKFNFSERQILNWLKENLDSSKLEVVSFDELKDVIYTGAKIDDIKRLVKVDIRNTVLVLEREALITVNVDEEKKEYTNFSITKEGLQALRQQV